jgi:hypothetical protein
MLITLLGIVMLVRLLQPLNAASPMLVTLLGIVMLVRLSYVPQSEDVIWHKVFKQGGNGTLFRFSEQKNIPWYPLKVPHAPNIVIG